MDNSYFYLPLPLTDDQIKLRESKVIPLSNNFELALKSNNCKIIYA